MRFLTFALILGLAGHAQASVWALYCRGPVTTRFSGADFLVDFEKAALAVGESGEKLKPSQCGWADRAMTSSESARLFIALGTPAMNNMFEKLAERSSIEKALLDPNLVLQIFVNNGDNRYFRGETGKGTGRMYTIFPARSNQLAAEKK